MGKVLWHVGMSLDGFIAGPGDAMEWLFEHWGGPNGTTNEVIESTGAILLGRRTYEIEDRDRRGFYGGAWAGLVFVLTHQPPATVPGWMTGTFISEPIDAAVAHAQQAASEKNVIILGANVAHQCLDKGLLDEIVVHLAPVLLGDGVRFFGNPGQGRIDLGGCTTRSTGSAGRWSCSMARSAPSRAASPGCCRSQRGFPSVELRDEQRAGLPNAFARLEQATEE